MVALFLPPAWGHGAGHCVCGQIRSAWGMASSPHSAPVVTVHRQTPMPTPHYCVWYKQRRALHRAERASKDVA